MQANNAGGPLRWPACSIPRPAFRLAAAALSGCPSGYLWPGLLRVPSTPVPGSDLLSLLTMEVLTLVMTGLCAAHCLKNIGAYSTVLFLVGSFFYTGALENLNLMILIGRFG